MRVVHLNRNERWEAVKVLVRGFVTSNDVLQRARDQKIFLYEAQFPARHDRVRRIQNTRNVFRPDLLFHRADVISAVEYLDVEVLRRTRGKQAQEVDGVSAVASNGNVI